MKNLQVLDCTLRDGGHVNNFDFGLDTIKKVSQALNNARIDIVEIGFLKNGEYEDNKSVFEYIDQAEKILPNEPYSSTFSIMIRPDWYDIDKLKPSKKIEIIRFAFYWDDIDLTIKQANIARKLGYKVFLNPVNITGYSDEGLKDLVSRLSDFEPHGVSIVDTFGCLTDKRLEDIYKVFESKIPKKVIVGLHLHENLSLALSLALHFYNISDVARNIVIDSSILGMGRIPGNLPTELFVGYFNKNINNKYIIGEVLKVAHELILPIKKIYPWGYSPIYAGSAFLGVHRSYPEFYEDQGLNYQQISAALSSISKAGIGGKFDRKLAEKIMSEARDKDGE